MKLSIKDCTVHGYASHKNEWFDQATLLSADYELVADACYCDRCIMSVACQLYNYRMDKHGRWWKPRIEREKIV